MARKPRPSIKIDPNSLSHTLQLVSNEIHSTNSVINKQLKELQTMFVETKDKDVGYQINKLLELQTTLITKRLELGKEQKDLIEKKVVVTATNDADPTDFKESKSPYAQPELPTRFYVYYHKNNRTGEIFYIGKGSGNRAYVGAGRTNAWKQYVVAIDYDYSVVILKDNLNEDVAYKEEQKFIIESATKHKLVNQLPNKIARRLGLPTIRKGQFDPKLTTPLNVL